MCVTCVGSLHAVNSRDWQLKKKVRLAAAVAIQTERAEKIDNNNSKQDSTPPA